MNNCNDEKASELLVYAIASFLVLFRNLQFLFEVSLFYCVSKCGTNFRCKAVNW